MNTTYTGGCQCGAVRYEVTADIQQVMSCNCSRCQRLGWLLTFVPQADFKLIKGENATSEYQFNKRNIHHLFCQSCGIESYAVGKGPNGADMVAINVRCLDGVDPEWFPVKKVDGRSL